MPFVCFLENLQLGNLLSKLTDLFDATNKNGWPLSVPPMAYFYYPLQIGNYVRKWRLMSAFTKHKFEKFWWKLKKCQPYPAGTFAPLPASFRVNGHSLTKICRFFQLRPRIPYWPNSLILLVLSESEFVGTSGIFMCFLFFPHIISTRIFRAYCRLNHTRTTLFILNKAMTFF